MGIYSSGNFLLFKIKNRIGIAQSFDGKGRQMLGAEFFFAGINQSLNKFRRGIHNYRFKLSDVSAPSLYRRWSPELMRFNDGL